MKEKLLHSRLLLIILTIIIILPVITVSKSRIIYYVKKNSAQLEKYVNREISRSDLDKTMNFKNDLDYNTRNNEDTRFVKFEVNSFGFASNACYRGFYYSQKDILHKFEYSDREIIGKNIEKYSVKEKTGDNTLYIEKIKDHWYYYEDCY